MPSLNSVAGLGPFYTLSILGEFIQHYLQSFSLPGAGSEGSLQGTAVASNALCLVSYGLSKQ